MNNKNRKDHLFSCYYLSHPHPQPHFSASVSFLSLSLTLNPQPSNPQTLNPPHPNLGRLGLPLIALLLVEGLPPRALRLHHQLGSWIIHLGDELGADACRVELVAGGRTLGLLGLDLLLAVAGLGGDETLGLGRPLIALLLVEIPPHLGALGDDLLGAETLADLGADALAVEDVAGVGALGLGRLLGLLGLALSLALGNALGGDLLLGGLLGELAHRLLLVEAIHLGELLDAHLGSHRGRHLFE